MQEFEQILSRLPANIAEILRQLAADGKNISPRELLRLISFLFASGAAYAELITQALVRLVMAGKLSGETLLTAMRLWGAGEGASIVAGAGGGAAGGAAAGTLLATVAAALAMLVSIYIAYSWISEEVKKDIEFPPQGVPCAAVGGNTTKVRKLSRSGIGSKTSLQRALNAAVEDVARTVRCGTGCPQADHVCAPMPVIISAVPKYRVFWTTTDVLYLGACQCLPVPARAAGTPGERREEGAGG